MPASEAPPPPSQSAKWSYATMSISSKSLSCMGLRARVRRAMASLAFPLRALLMAPPVAVEYRVELAALPTLPARPRRRRAVLALPLLIPSCLLVSSSSSPPDRANAESSSENSKSSRLLDSKSVPRNPPPVEAIGAKSSKKNHTELKLCLTASFCHNRSQQLH